MCKNIHYTLAVIVQSIFLGIEFQRFSATMTFLADDVRLYRISLTSQHGVYKFIKCNKDASFTSTFSQR